MYSLYRAWLSLGPCGAVTNTLPTLPSTITSGTTLNLASPTHLPGSPDVSLQVGPSLTHFSAHKAVLSVHSGFFKAALTNHTGTTPIAVPNVNVDEFSSLLTFMYTGYLDLNLSNIYNILLATHILHMPRALEICRTFLMQSQPIETRPSIIKPIPSRKSALPHQQIFPPAYTNLQKSETTPFRTIVNEKRNEPSTSKTNETQERNNDGNAQRKPLEKIKVPKKRSELGNEKIIIDIACCDGPVRFHKVINNNYGLPNDAENDYRQIREIDRNDVMNKIMNENIRDKQMSDENQIQNGGPSDMFTCLYCNHTFKSQYCYQKHARRHLNPVSLEVKTVQKAETKREVKLLDMNVQYYPCKTCGSKFPSYYFVHKHRKLCHADEMADTNNKNNEMVAEKQNNNSNQDTSDSKSNSAIDVEAVNQ